MQVTESQIQSRSIGLFSKKYPEYRGLLFAIHNNSNSKISGSVAVAMGRVAGVSDTIFLSPYGPLLIEFKDETGKQRPEQVFWEKLVTRNGYPYVIIRSVEQFDFIIEQWLESFGKLSSVKLAVLWANKLIDNGN